MKIPESNVTSTISTYEKHMVKLEIKIKLKCAFCGYEQELTEQGYQSLLSIGGPVCPDCLEYKSKRSVTMEVIS